MKKFCLLAFVFLTFAIVQVSLASTNLTVGTLPMLPSFGLARGLTGYWTMDGKDINWSAKTMLDRSGNGHTATMVGFDVSTSTAVGKIGQALFFLRKDNSTGSSLNVGNYTAVQTNYTVAFWLKSSAISGTPLMRGNTTDCFYNPRIFVPSPGNLTVAESGCSGVGEVGTYAIDPNKWYHFAVTRSGQTVRVYQNGTLVTTDNSQPSPLATDLGRFYIGTGHTGSEISNPFLGLLDDVRTYNRALDPTEVLQLYNQNASRFSVSPTPPALAVATGLNRGLVGYWTMDGKDVNWSANTMLDRSGNGNTISLLGFAISTSTSPGKIGQALKFDGVGNTKGSYLSRGPYTTEQTAYSTAFWFKIPTAGSGGNLFLRGATTACFRNPQVFITGGTAMTVAESGCSGSGNISSFTLTPDKWYHLVVTRSGQTVKVYLDGALRVTDTSQPSPVTTTTGKFQIGAGYTGSAVNSFYSGFLDDVRVYSRVLNATEILQLYNQGKLVF